MLKEYLGKLGLNDREQSLYLALARVGVQPASVIARRMNEDRVVTYKYLKRLESLGLTKVYIRDGIQYFGITGAEGLKAYLQEREYAITELSSHIPEAEAELKQITRGEGFVPTVQVFQGKSGMKAMFRDLLFEAKHEGVVRIRMMTSNTFDQQMGSTSLAKFTEEFFQDAQKASLAIEMLEASGTLIPEYIRRLDPLHFNPREFPAARGATNVFLVGMTLYLACYGDSLIGLKLKQEQMSQIFHFFFDAIGKNLPPPNSNLPRGPEEWLRK